ncbi:MAG: tRNA-(ms[2]io[6]A)-hydroxylase [Chitinophagales bacterium]|nr:tRNA-(ms[2]io[6]A)-hydroxylase [Chitinophagales bacterium]
MILSLHKMFRLKLPTDPRWADLASLSLEEILTDHAYCEQKATSTCISLIQNYPDREELVKQLAPIVTEEWAHFRMVISELKKRKLKLGKQRKDEYVIALRKLIRTGDRVERQLMDKLLVSALIEARSCERFRILSENLPQPELRKFYRIFMESEAGHYTLFMKLAKKYMPAKVVNERWREMLEAEKEIMKSLEIRGERIH